MRGLIVILVALSLGMGIAPAQAQTSEVVVPDLVGLNVPQAAAALNAAGLMLGEEIQLPGALDGSLPLDTVSAQSVEAGASVPAGSPISIGVARAPNMRLIYGDTFVTLVNPTGAPVDLRALGFADASNTASLGMAGLLNTLDAGNCVQIWSVLRRGPQNLADCTGMQRWQSTSDRQYHFWTAANGVQEFMALDAGVPLVTCPAAPVGSDASPLVCEFFYGGAEASALLTDYLYFSYTPDVIALINVSDDRWMPTAASTLYNYNPRIAIQGVPLRFGDAELFQEQHRLGPGDFQRLAPGQCLAMTTVSSAIGAAPEDCVLIAQRDLGPDVAFWLADFEVEGVTTGYRVTCPAPTPERVTVCIVPR